MSVTSSIIDDLAREPPIAAIGSYWQLFTDQVMGGVSKATIVRDAVAGRAAIRMRGDVSLENNGGFVQIVLDLSPDGRVVDASAWSGIEIDVFGDAEPDTGIKRMILWVSAESRPPGLTANSALRESVSVSVPAQDPGTEPALQYAFVTGGASQPMAPSEVDRRVGHGINTGRNVVRSHLGMRLRKFFPV